MKTRQIAFPFLLLATACGADGVEWASVAQSVAPAGSAAVVVSSDVPTTVAAGERLNITVRMRNTGTASPGNDWDTNYRFTNAGVGFGFGYIRVPAAAVPVEAGIQEEQDFRFVLTMPTSGSSNFLGRMYTDTAGASGFFGDTLTSPVTVSTDPNFLRRWDCGYVSDDIPSVMAPGERRTVNITVRNDGTANWAANTLCLYARDTPFSLWGGVYCPLNSASAAGATQLSPGTGENLTFRFPITAPSTPGTYTFRRQMFNSTTNGGVGFFDVSNHCVDRTIIVTTGSSLPYDATFAANLSNIDDTPMGTWRPGENRKVTVTMINSGLNPWNTANPFLLYSASSPLSLFKPVPYDVVDADVPPATTHTFDFYARAPTTPGSYQHRWRMWSNQANPNYFGDLIDFPVVVDAAAQPQFDAVIDSVVIPTSVNRQSNVQFRVTVRNTGFGTWDSSEFGLQSVGSPNYTWGVTFVPLPSGVTVAPGATHEFVVNGLAPSPPGVYDSNWRMYTTGGGFGFGATTINSVTVSSNCGNGVVDTGSGETCDDGNLINGDGCSSTCTIETQTLDLATPNIAARTLYGVQSARDLGSVAIGDLDNDGAADIVVGAFSTVTATTPNRVLAGEVWVHSGAGFRDNTETPASQGALLHIWGAREGDQLGGGPEGGIKIADVTGDGIADLLVSAPFAACAAGTGTCGRVYVIRGGSTFPTGSLDLANPPADVVAQLVAPTDGDHAVVLAARDLTGDGVADIVVGHPKANGTRGRVVVVQGGAGLTGVFSTTAANVLAEIAGANVDDQLGQNAAIGQIDGSGNMDLLLGSARFDPMTGGSGAGGAWAFFSPLSGSYDLAAGAEDVAWYGPGVRDAMGKSVAIADVTGDGAPDVLIGTTGSRFTGNIRFGTVDVWAGPFTTGTTNDMAAGATPDVAIQGREAEGAFGVCVGAGDVNGDGVSDVFGAAFTSSGSSGTVVQAGELAVTYGGAGLTSGQVAEGTTPILLYGGQDRGRMCLYQNGLAIGDLDGDGRADYCVASPQASVPGSGLYNEGRVDCFVSPF